MTVYPNLAALPPRQYGANHLQGVKVHHPQATGTSSLSVIHQVQVVTPPHGYLPAVLKVREPATLPPGNGLVPQQGSTPPSNAPSATNATSSNAENSIKYVPFTEEDISPLNFIRPPRPSARGSTKAVQQPTSGPPSADNSTASESDPASYQASVEVVPLNYQPPNWKRPQNGYQGVDANVAEVVVRTRISTLNSTGEVDLVTAQPVAFTDDTVSNETDGLISDEYVRFVVNPSVTASVDIDNSPPSHSLDLESQLQDAAAATHTHQPAGRRQETETESNVQAVDQLQHLTAADQREALLPLANVETLSEHVPEADVKNATGPGADGQIAASWHGDWALVKSAYKAGKISPKGAMYTVTQGHSKVKFFGFNALHRPGVGDPDAILDGDSSEWKLVPSGVQVDVPRMKLGPSKTIPLKYKTIRPVYLNQRPSRTSAEGDSIDSSSSLSAATTVISDPFEYHTQLQKLAVINQDP